MYYVRWKDGVYSTTSFDGGLLSYKELDDYIFRVRLEEGVFSSFSIDQYWENNLVNQIKSTQPYTQYLCSGLGMAKDETVRQWSTDKKACHLSKEEKNRPGGNRKMVEYSIEVFLRRRETVG